MLGVVELEDVHDIYEADGDDTKRYSTLALHLVLVSWHTGFIAESF